MSPSRKRLRRMEESPPNLPHDSPQPKQQDAHECGLATPPYHGIADLDSRDIQALSSLYTPSAFAKIWFTAQKGLARPSPPTLYPEYTKPGGTEYVYRELDFWTSGFFPGCLYLLLERQRKHGHVLGSAASTSQEKVPHHLQLSFACTWWTENLHQNATLATTHDLGFMILPWAGPAWSLHGDARAFDTIRTAAETLASRFSPTLGCIRSWDTCVTKKYNFSDPDSDFLVIIDNMMNLNLLFTAASLTSSPRLRDVAVAHARRTQQTHVRGDFSTTHLVVLDPATGNIKERLTNQGYAHDSCWARGQAWAIAGFAEVYQWTLDDSFLATARGCADYFLARLPASGVPPWDFDAPGGDGEPRDTSAALIAAYGMALLEESLRARGESSSYLAAVLRLVEAVNRHHLNPPARFVVREEATQTVEHGEMRDAVRLDVDVGTGETIVNGATINNYEFAPRRWANHGLVYADYFYLLLGNKLLDMGVGGLILKRHAAGGSDQNGARSRQIGYTH